MKLHLPQIDKHLAGLALRSIVLVSIVAAFVLPARAENQIEVREKPRSRLGRTARDQTMAHKLLFDDLSPIEEQQLAELWNAVLRSPSTSIVKRRFNAETFEKNFLQVFEDYVRKKNYKDYEKTEVSVRMPSFLGLALTVPSLEPTYPRLGTGAPPYNFGKGPHGGVRVELSGASIGATSLLGQDLRERRLRGKIVPILEQLVANFKTYKRLPAKETESDALSRVQARKVLVELAGENSVSALDSLPPTTGLPSGIGPPYIPSMQKALDAEKKGDKLASYYWFRVAHEQASARLCADAVKSAKHALEIHTKIRDGCFFYSVMLPDPQPPNPLADGLIPRDVLVALRECNRASDANELMKAAVAKANGLYGADSSVSEYQFCMHALSQLPHSYEDFDKLFDVNPRLLEVGGVSSAIEQIYNFAHARMWAHRGEEARTVLVHLLAAQRKAFESNDLRLVKTLKFLARAKQQQGDFKGAVEDLTEVTEIYPLYESADRKHYFWLLADALDKAGRKADANRVRVRMNEKDRIPGVHEWMNEVKNIRVNTRLSYAKRINLMLALLAKAEQRIKYSSACAEIQSQIIPLAERSHDWKTLAEVASKRCAIYERTPDVSAGRSQGCTPVLVGRMDYYCFAANAYLKMGRTAEAEQIIRRALRIMPDLREQEISAAKEVLSRARQAGNQ